MNQNVAKPATLQRVRATGHLAVKRSAGRSRIDVLYQDGSAKIRFPTPESESLEAILINTAGGLTAGDRISWQIDAGAGTRVVMTTQASEKVYRAEGGRAEADIRMSAGKDAHLSWLPQETIAYDRSALRRRIEVDLAQGASCLLVEPLVLGRRAMGETVDQCLFHDSWRITCAGSLVHAEEFRVDGDATGLMALAASGNGATAFATILMIAPNPTMFVDELRHRLASCAALDFGVSAWSVAGTGKLLARIAARDGFALKNAVAGAVRLLNGSAGLPKIWAS
ncbi:MAG: urease accessory protein UreD [Nitratireductor sp.]|nr:urease accessory protein UreD [Nitratireductor sp.]